MPFLNLFIYSSEYRKLSEISIRSAARSARIHLNQLTKTRKTSKDSSKFYVLSLRFAYFPQYGIEQ